MQISVCVIIPTYNNAATLCDVVSRAYVQLQTHVATEPHVIVVNDGSTDDTLERLAALDIPVELVTYGRNRGKGHALIAGFRHARALGYDYAITLDADGQHYPEDIPALLQAHIDHPGTIIVGCRSLRGKDMSPASRFANHLSNFWFAAQTTRFLRDTQTGYRLYPLRHLHWLWLITSRYEAELELMVYASWHDVPLLSVPVNVYYPPRTERVSHFRPAYDFMRITLFNTWLCLGSGFYGYPRKFFKGLRSIITSHLVIAIFMLGAVVSTVAAACFMLVARHSERGRYNFHCMLCGLSRFIVAVMPCVRHTTHNTEGERFDRPAVIVSNHQSLLDLLYAMALTPRLVIITKRWVWRNPIFGLPIRYAQFLPVTSGYDEITERCRRLVARGYSVLVYPEGTRSVDGRVQRFHRGAFHLAEQLGIDVLPIVECGPGRVLPKKGLFYLRSGHVHIKFLPRIKPTDTQWGETVKERTRSIERYMRDEYRRLNFKCH